MIKIQGAFSIWRSHRALVAGICLAILCLATFSARGGLIELGSPTDFFTTVAARLLRSELNLDLNQIQIYPTNQYTPAVHRLLQVTANLYDSMTNRAFGAATNDPFCPSVFRPLFRRIDSGSNSTVVIAGYREINDAGIADSRLAPLMLELGQANPPLQSVPPQGTPFSTLDKDEPMVSGVTLIIAARKGFPNFNELAMSWKPPRIWSIGSASARIGRTMARSSW